VRPALSVLVIVLLGCMDQSVQTLNGVWRADNQVPGSRIMLAIAERDTTISGSGTYSIEAGRSGTLRIAGSLRESQIRLTLTYDYGQTARYSGTVLDNTHMTGTVAWSSGFENPLAFSRIPNVP
jgi:hypothetical protein